MTTNEEIANGFASYYSTSQKKTHHIRHQDRIIKKLLVDKAKEPLTTNTPEYRIFNDNFTTCELDNAINQLKYKKSPGPDNIFAEFLHHMGNNAQSTILQLFNQIWNSTIPSQWKKSVVIPILKKNKPFSNFQNYREISLTSILGKDDKLQTKLVY